MSSTNRWRGRERGGKGERGVARERVGGGACVVLTGTAHATFEKNTLKNGMQEWVEFVGPLSDNAFDCLLRLHPVLGKPNIAPEAKRTTNFVPRELIHLDVYISKSPGVYISNHEVDNLIRLF